MLVGLLLLLDVSHYHHHHQQQQRLVCHGFSPVVRSVPSLSRGTSNARTKRKTDTNRRNHYRYNDGSQTKQLMMMMLMTDIPPSITTMSDLVATAATATALSPSEVASSTSSVSLAELVSSLLTSLSSLTDVGDGGTDVVMIESSSSSSSPASSLVLSPSQIWIVFGVGVFPFAVATIEFWRRVRVGEAFGTGKDSVVFQNELRQQQRQPSSSTDTTVTNDNDDNPAVPTKEMTTIGQDDVSPLNSRGRRVLGTDALITAIVLFVVSFGTLGIVLYSVTTSEPPPPLSSTSISVK